jgi:uncharacterized integral membrane protein
MRSLKLGLLVLLGLCLLTVALANRGPVTLRLLPADLEALLGWSWAREVPLFVVLFGGAVVGLLIGIVWEWLREHRQRAEAAEMRRTLARFEAELGRLRGSEAKDEVLALVEGGGKASKGR